MKSVWLFLVAVGITLVAGWVILDSADSQIAPATLGTQPATELTSDPDLLGQVQAPESNLLQPEPGVSQVTETQGESSAAPSALRTAVSAGLAGHVLSETGVPIEGAIVSWTPLDLAVNTVAYSPLSYEEWSRASVLVATDSEGGFSLGERDVPGAVWVTVGGWEAAGRETAGGAQDLELRLREQAAWDVSVVGLDAFDGGWVDVQGFEKDGVSSSDSSETFLGQLFRRRVPIDENGACAFGAPDLVAMQAVWRDRRSVFAWDFDSRVVELRIEDVIEVTGFVRAFEEWGPVGIDAYFERTNDRVEWLGTFSVEPDGEVMGHALPVLGDGTYRFQMGGFHAAPEIQRFASSEIGSSVRLDFEAQAALKLKLQFRNQQNQPVEGVTVGLRWPAERGDGIENLGIWFASEADGSVDVPCRGGLVYLDYGMTGYSPGSFGPFNADEWVDKPIEVTLIPSGTVRGRVTFEGKAVEDFAVVHFQGSGWGSFTTTKFEGAEGGAFELVDVVGGEVSVLAQAAGLAQSEMVVVEVTRDAVAEVELLLTAGGRGVGRALDAETLLPIPGLSVHRPTRARDGVIGVEVGGGVLANADGSFEIAGMIGSRTRVVLVAEGYSRGEAVAGPQADGSYDFGTTLLTRAKEFVGRVRVPEGVDPTGITYSITQGFYAGPGYVESSGEFKALNGMPGPSTFDLTLPDGQMRSFERFLTGSGPWVEDFDLNSPIQLRVVVNGLGKFESGDLDQAQFEVCAEAGAGGLWMTSIYQDLSNDFEAGTLIGGVVAGSHGVNLYSTNGVLLAFGRVEIGADARGEVFVHLDVIGAGRAVQVLDQSGQAVVGITVKVVGPGMGKLLTYADTDDAGVAQLGYLGDGPFMIRIGGMSTARMDLELAEMGTEDNPTQITFETPGKLRVHVTDRGMSLEGVPVYVTSALSGLNLAWTSVGTGGMVEVLGITPGACELLVNSPLIWSEVKAAQADEGGTLQQVEFRRLGDLELLVLQANGSPLVGVDVGIESVEYAVDVATWLAQGRVQSGGGVVTDSDGMVRIAGLPNGAFSWTAAGVEGVCQVPALGLGSATAKAVE